MKLSGWTPKSFLALRDHRARKFSTLLLCGAREQPARLMRQVSFAQHVGQENICSHVTAPLLRAHAVYDQEIESGVAAV